MDLFQGLRIRIFYTFGICWALISWNWNLNEQNVWFIFGIFMAELNMTFSEEYPEYERGCAWMARCIRVVILSPHTDQVIIALRNQFPEFSWALERIQNLFMILRQTTIPRATDAPNQNDKFLGLFGLGVFMMFLTSFLLTYPDFQEGYFLCLPFRVFLINFL